ncbi:MAG: peroxiredoxin [Cognaticolwellia sp.]|jgi:peroxiredoxin
MLIAFFLACSTASTPVAIAELPTPIQADAKAKLGEAAPDFSLPDVDGTIHSLADHSGKVVVLEWFNPGCPFVKAAYGKDVVQELSASHATDTVWLRINSGSAGKQGAGADENKRAARKWDIEGPVLLDASGAVGKAYGAKTTPQIVVIDTQGTVRFNGALDNAPLGASQGEYKPYAGTAIAGVLAGTELETTRPKPWGCSVKY